MALMKTGARRWVLVAVSGALMALCIAFSWDTRDAMSQLPFLRRQDAVQGVDPQIKNLVDIQPWQTAEALTAMAGSAEELRYAREAEHLADHEVDQAFAAALREASLLPQHLGGEALRFSQKVERLRQVVSDDGERVKALTANDPDGDLDVAKAQLDLDTDQFNEANQDRVRAGGDNGERIQQELAAHEAAMKKYDAQASGNAPPPVEATKEHPTLAGYIQAWTGERKRYALVRSAAAQAKADATAFGRKHDELEKYNPAISGLADEGKASRLARIAAQATRSQLLGIYDDRIETEQRLADEYSRWAAQVMLQHKLTERLMLQSLAIIFFIMICVLVLEAVAMHVIHQPALDQRRMETLGTILKLGIQCAAVLLALLVIFGVPSQISTILGLATAGLTVVLQDFIIAFFGWFVLMGRNGIRMGDWVEINGVTGEVVNIGLLRTALLETGNLADKGHPTGRRATFLNSFAIRGQYFNFSTAGQWMWDEIRMALPAGQDAHEAITKVRESVVQETAKDTQEAEQEWKRVTRRNALTRFTPEPAVDMRPGASGIDIVVRYVTRAGDRFEVRNRLYERVLALLHST